jgi:hypothetical protein
MNHERQRDNAQGIADLFLAVARMPQDAGRDEVMEDLGLFFAVLMQNQIKTVKRDAVK